MLWVRYKSFFLSFSAFAVPSDDIFEPEVHSCSPQENNNSERHPSSDRFGSGISSTPILSAADTARGVTQSGDSFPMLYGFAHDGSSQRLAFSKYRYDGRLDTAFGTSGKTTHDPTAFDDLIHATSPGNASTLTNTFVGRGGSNYVQWLIGRIQSNGRLDTSFYTSGTRLGTFYPEAEVFRGIENSVLAGGYAWQTGRYNFVTAKFRTDGALDTSFNTLGFNLTTVSLYDSGALAITIGTIGGGLPNTTQPITAGSVQTGGNNWDFALVRYRSDGVLDTTFNSTGMRIESVLSSNDKAYAIARHEGYRGSIYQYVVGGYAFNGSNNDFALMGILSNGGLDTAFNTRGKVTTSFGTGDDVVFGVSVTRPDYQGISSLNYMKSLIYAIGSTNNGADTDVAIARYFSNGVLDTSFYTDGKATFDINGGNDVGTSIYMPAGAFWFWASASVTNAGNQDFAILRIESDGTLAQSSAPSRSFGTNGVTVSDISGGTDAGIAISNSPPVLGFGNAGGHMAVARLGPGVLEIGAGSFLDTSFDTDGYKVFNLGGTETMYGAMYYSNNSLMVGENGADYLVEKLYWNNGNANSLNTTFNTAGYITLDFSGNDRAYSADSIFSIVVGRDGSTPTAVAWAKFLTNGLLDTAFFTSGKRTLNPSGNSAAAKKIFLSWQNDTHRFIAGDDGQDMFVYRIFSDGRLDTTFNTSGLKLVDFGGSETFGSATSDASSRTLILIGGNGSDFAISRLIGNTGALDTSFSTTGKMTIDFGGAGEMARALVAEDQSFGGGTPNYYYSRFFVAGDDGTNFLVARVLRNGGLDTSFNTTGKRSYPLTGASTLGGIAVDGYGVPCIVGSTNGNTDWVTMCINP